MTRPTEQDGQALAASHAVLADCPTAAATLDGAGRVVFWNPAAEQLLGHNRSEVVGRPLAEIVTMPPELTLRLAGWGALGVTERQQLQRGLRLPASCADGTEVGISLSVTDAPDGAAIVWLQSRAEVPVPRQEPDVFRIIFERAPEAITVLDADLRQRHVNPAGLELVGLPAGLEDVGQGGLYLHPDDQRILDDRTHRRRAGQPVPEGPVRYRVAHTDGTWRWLESLTVDLRDVPSVNGFVVLSRDVTEDEEHRVALEAATERLAELDRSRNHLLSAVSHELRTPLAAIVSASEYLATEPVEPAEMTAYAELIRRNAGRLEALVTDLLLVGRIQNGTLPVELSPVELAAVVEQVVDALGRPDGPPITMEIQQGPPVRADAGRLAQVIENLVTNALKFGGDEGVRVTGRVDADHWTLCVADRGPGIDAELLERVFEPFFRAPATERTAGTGLGLAITRGIVDLHGGTLDLGPAEGGGTEAVVTLPIWADDETGLP